jgi:hypothetical protein
MAFKKGESGNPKGRAKLPYNINAAKGSASIEVLSSIYKFGMMPRSKFNEYLKSDEPTMWERVTAGCFMKATQGSLNHIEALWSRVIGPAPKVLAVDGLQMNNVQLNQPQDTESLTHILIKLKQAAEQERDCTPIQDISKSSSQSPSLSLPQESYTE